MKLVPCFELLYLDPLSTFDNLHHAANSLPRALTTIRKIKIKNWTKEININSQIYISRDYFRYKKILPYNILFAKYKNIYFILVVVRLLMYVILVKLLTKYNAISAFNLRAVLYA